MSTINAIVNHLDSQPTQASAVRRGFAALPCLQCGNGGDLHIDLSDLTGKDAIACGSCETTYSVGDVRETLDRWRDVLTWIDLAPLLKE